MKKLPSYDEFLNEGTWALNQDKLDAYIKELNTIKSPSDINDKLYKKWWNVVGDDILYDHLDAAKENEKGEWKAHVLDAVDRLKELKQAKKDK